jgi:S1-C subfamily serine protease
LKTAAENAQTIFRFFTSVFKMEEAIEKKLSNIEKNMEAIVIVWYNNAMKRFILLMSVFFAAIVCISAQQNGFAQQSSGLSQKAVKLVQTAVFEVVIEKPKNDSLTYDKELDWTLVDFRIRNDEYYSIGTAFAISPTELLSAFHVIDLAHPSMTNNKYFIRDSNGEVTEIDQIISASNERDFIIFTAKDKTFDSYFELEETISVGDPVFSIGNALGEGIVVRNGLALGTIPENENGRWNLLKSSADGNPGNSGGPLVTHEGKVVGVVISLRDNILYSTPIDVVFGIPEDLLQYRLRTSYGHFILPNNRISVYETSVDLPKNYHEIQDFLFQDYHAPYVRYMEELFDQVPEYLTSPNNYHLKSSMINSINPGISLLDKNDDQWKIYTLNFNNYAIPNDGSLRHVNSNNEFTFVKLNSPRDVSASDLNTNPKFLMDYILKYLRMERNLGGEKYRILSFGDPMEIGSYKDMLGRTWINAQWLIDYDDSILNMYILPLPNGPAIVWTNQPSAYREVYNYDIKIICDHLQAAYFASFEDWEKFLALKEYIPDVLKDFSFDWNESTKTFKLNNTNISMQASPDVFDWQNTSEMLIAPAYYTQDGKTEFGIREIILRQDLQGKNSCILFKYLEPVSELGAAQAESYADIVAGKYPLDETAVITPQDNSGSIASVLQTEMPASGIQYALYLNMTEPETEENIANRFRALKDYVKVKR